MSVSHAPVAEFTDTKESEAAAAAFLRVTQADLRKLLAEGRTTLWGEDLARYRARRDSVPLALGGWSRAGGKGGQRRAKGIETSHEGE